MCGNLWYFSFHNILVYSVVGIEFPNDREKFVGYCQSACGLGLMSGPVIGALIYDAVGFEYTFMIFSALLTLTGLLCLVFLPNRLNKLAETSEEEKRKSQ